MLRDVRQRNRTTSDSASRSRTVSFADDSEKRRKPSDTSRFPPLSPVGFLEWCHGHNLIYFFFALTYMCGILLFVHRCQYRLLQNSGKDVPFNGHKARAHLHNISSIGPRPGGSFENDVLAVNYIVNAIDDIKERYLNERYEIHVELQHIQQTGLTLERYGQHFSAAVNNITNVIVIVKPVSSQGDDLVLVNSHYDTQPGTRGASDATASCAVMLQAIETIVADDKSATLQRGVLFLFNGAEESILVASHGYVTQHATMKHVRAFINLEAGGSGGKQLVFQAGPDSPWISDLYVRDAPHPFTSIFAQEIFQSQLIPSDTDFRVFRDYGNISGIDIAYVRNGYVYHTRNDVPEVIPFGSLQSAGDNLMALIAGMTGSPMLTAGKRHKHGAMVFFDVFGLFAVSFPFRLLQIINVGFAVVAVVFVVAQVMKPGKISSDPTIVSVMVGLSTILISLLCGAATIAVVALIVTKTGNSLTWYSQPLFAVALYGGPCVSSMLTCHVSARKLYKKVSNRGRTSMSYLMEDSCVFSYFILVSLVLLYLTHKQIMSSFLMTGWIVFPFVGHLMSRYFRSGPPQFQRHVAAVISQLVGHCIPATFVVYHLYTLYEVFIPIAGRSGTELPSELVIGFIGFLTVINASAFLISAVHSIYRVGRTLIIVSLLLYIPLIVALSGVMFPYSALTAKRLFLQHTQRTFWDTNNNVIKQDSGIWIVPYDYLNIEPLRKHVPAINSAKQLECDGPYCGYPSLYPMRFGIKKTWLAEAPRPLDASPVHLEVLSRSRVSDLVERVTVRLRGPKRMNLYIVSSVNVSLVSWTVTGSSPKGIVDYDGRICYYVYLTAGFYSSPWEFSFDFQKSSPNSVASLAEFAVASHQFQDSLPLTAELVRLRSSLPGWVVDTSWVSSYDRWFI